MAERQPGPVRSLGDWRRTAEAALWLAAVGVGLRTLSFARLAGLAAGGARRRESASDAAVGAAVGRAVEAAARRAPWPVRCFETGLAAHAMLRLRGRPSVLYYGGRNGGSRGTTAHVWVELGGSAVVGGGAAADFAVLAAFPDLEPAEQAGA